MVGTKQFENKTAKGMKGSGGKQAELSISCLRISPCIGWEVGARCVRCLCVPGSLRVSDGMSREVQQL